MNVDTKKEKLNTILTKKKRPWLFSFKEGKYFKYFTFCF